MKILSDKKFDEICNEMIKKGVKHGYYIGLRIGRGEAVLTGRLDKNVQSQIEEILRREL